jgi:hypothetical protein
MYEGRTSIDDGIDGSVPDDSAIQTNGIDVHLPESLEIYRCQGT